VTEVRWVQDEPSNQGAWPFMALNLPDALAEAAPGKRWDLIPVTRPASSAPSVGSAKVHETQQRDLVEKALA
jgi:2-oxoglutarate dehydrogenase E1 component